MIASELIIPSDVPIAMMCAVASRPERIYMFTANHQVNPAADYNADVFIHIYSSHTKHTHTHTQHIYNWPVPKNQEQGSAQRCTMRSWTTTLYKITRFEFSNKYGTKHDETCILLYFEIWINRPRDRSQSASRIVWITSSDWEINLVLYISRWNSRP